MFDGLPLDGLQGKLYVPPQRMFWRCPRCQALVLKTQEGLVTPALGYRHVCRKETRHG